MIDFVAWYEEQKCLLQKVPVVQDPMDHVLDRWARRSGVWCEFGVGDGTRLRRIVAARGDAVVFGFDWFKGLPEDWKPGYPKGSFAVDAPPDVPGANLVVGLFEDTVADFFANRCPPDEVTFAHVDCDLYVGAKVALTCLLPHLADGAVIAFDEIFQYPGHEEHELRALYETYQLGLRFEWIAWDRGEKAAVRVRAK